MAMVGAPNRNPLRRSVGRHAVLMLAAFAMAYPLLWMMASSFKPEELIFSEPGLIPGEWDWNNYAEGWNALRVSFTQFYINSFIVASLAVVGNLLACSLAAYAFARLNFGSSGCGSR